MMQATHDEGRGATMPPRPLRADARLNQDRLLRAARNAFARDGAQASLKAIARDAGVGIGTLYRRFRTRDQLIEATYRDEIAELCVNASELLGRMPPERALAAWTGLLLDHMATMHGMPDMFPALLSVTDGPCQPSRQLLLEAMSALLTAGAEGGGIQPDIDPADVLMALSGIGLVATRASQQGLAPRLATLLLNGLTTRPVPSPYRPE